MKKSGPLLVFWYVLAIAFLFAPIAASIIYSFNTGSLGKQTSTFTGWTASWFVDAWSNASLRQSMLTSLKASFWAALVAVVLGTCLGLAMARHPSPNMRRVASVLVNALLIIPETVIGVSLLLFYAESGFELGMATLVFGISSLGIAVTALIVRAGLLTLDRSLEEAAIDLGANQWQVLKDIIFPHLAPAIIVAALVSYVFAFDNLVISNFLATPVVNTLPVYLFGSLQYGPSPAIYAAATSIFGLTLLLLVIAVLIYASTFGRRMVTAK